jgi:hypothetical protein
MGDFRLETFMRQGSSGPRHSKGRRLYCGLGQRQPLLLHREPNNPHDSNAVKVTDLLGQRVGYVAREDAVVVSAKMAQGLVLLCRTDGPCLCVVRPILIWSDGEVLEIEKKKQKAKPKGRELVHVTDLPPQHFNTPCRSPGLFSRPGIS